MTRHTRWSLLLGAVIACIGMAGLHRVAKRTAYRYRLMEPVLKNASPREAQSEGYEWATHAEAREAA